jgi:hypothetical protein
MLCQNTLLGGLRGSIGSVKNVNSLSGSKRHTGVLSIREIAMTEHGCKHLTGNMRQDRLDGIDEAARI